MNAPAVGKFRDPSLVDFGADETGWGRRLELLGGVLVDRPLLHEGLPPCKTRAWAEAGAIFEPGAVGGGGWSFRGPLPDPWRVAVPLDRATLALEVRPAPSGQIGFFLEQVPQWAWLARVTPPAAKVLSLFAHSGAATLALAAAGAQVVHVDASRPALALARRNAEASGLADAPIRYLCEDAAAFVARELRRGARYDGAVLDPPSWGHGPDGQPFAIDRDLAPLLADVSRLLGRGPAGPVLLTCHSPRWHHRRLAATLSGCLPRASTSRVESGPLACVDAGGRTIELGDFARVAPLPAGTP
jgi:23S rRNA (cytosine1962-C5)-methyltransferase